MAQLADFQFRDGQGFINETGEAGVRTPPHCEPRAIPVAGPSVFLLKSHDNCSLIPGCRLRVANITSFGIPAAWQRCASSAQPLGRYNSRSNKVLLYWRAT